MASTFAWLDHSKSDRRKALDVVDLFREQDTRDELGIGTVRDAIAGSLPWWREVRRSVFRRKWHTADPDFRMVHGAVARQSVQE